MQCKYTYAHEFSYQSPNQIRPAQWLHVRHEARVLPSRAHGAELTPLGSAGRLRAGMVDPRCHPKIWYLGTHWSSSSSYSSCLFWKCWKKNGTPGTEKWHSHKLPKSPVAWTVYGKLLGTSWNIWEGSHPLGILPSRCLWPNEGGARSQPQGKQHLPYGAVWWGSNPPKSDYCSEVGTPKWPFQLVLAAFSTPWGGPIETWRQHDMGV